MPDDAPATRTHSPADFLDRPSPARIYDYFLGGENNFEIDRRAGDAIRADSPDVPQIAWDNRRFLHRSVRHLAGAGIRQFLDIGAGLPTVGPVHEVAGTVDPDAHVVYVDSDPLVLAQSRTLLPADGTAGVVTADLRDPASVLGNADVRELIDFGQPVALLFFAVLHFVTDADDPAGLLRTYRDAVPSGSYLVISHADHEELSDQKVRGAESVYEGATSNVQFRSRAEIEAFFGGWDLLEPGLVYPSRWRAAPPANGVTAGVLAGVARKP